MYQLVISIQDDPEMKQIQVAKQFKNPLTKL